MLLRKSVDVATPSAPRGPENQLRRTLTLPLLVASDGQLPNALAVVDPEHRTPSRATMLVGVAIIALTAFFPLVTLAKATSIITLTAFTLVNIALIRLTRTNSELARRRWLVTGSLGAVASAGLGAWQVVELF